MIILTQVEICDEAIISNVKKLINQIYKLLPNREEGIDWETPLSTIVEELAGMAKLLPVYHEILFALLCKLEGLFSLTQEEDFFNYRRTIFECLSLMQELKRSIEGDI